MQPMIFVACRALIKDFGCAKAVFSLMKLIVLNSFSNPKGEKVSKHFFWSDPGARFRLALSCIAKISNSLLSAKLLKMAHILVG